MWLSVSASAALAARARAQDAGVPDAGTEPSREAEEAEVAAELSRIQAGQNAEGADRAAAPSAPYAAGSPDTSAAPSSSARGLSNVLNPAISANGLVLVGGTTRPEANDTDPDRGELVSGITLQEVELQASAVVDPYFRADVILAGNLEEIGFEEAYLTTLELPRATIRAGQMRAALGRHNPLHTHAFPFLTAPLPWRVLLGPEGLLDPGVSVDLLLPLPFYAEITGQAFSGQWQPLEGSIEDDPATPIDETVPDRRRDLDLAYLGHLKTLFDLADSATIELGGTYVGGRNGFGGLTSIAAADLTFKWRPVEAERYTSFDWTTEYVWVLRDRAPTDRSVGGAYSGVRFQFSQRWWVQARGAVLGIPKRDSPRAWRAEALVAFVPSEFSTLRLQYAFETDDSSATNPIHEVFLQGLFSIGSHPAHAY